MSVETITIPKVEYEQLKSAEAQVATLQQEIQWLTEQIRLARKQRFGSSSEKSKTDDSCEQLSYLFNEAESMADEKQPEPSDIVVKAHARKARRSTQEKLPEDIEVEIIEKT